MSVKRKADEAFLKDDKKDDEHDDHKDKKGKKEEKKEEEKKKEIVKTCPGEPTFEIVYAGSWYGVDLETMRKWCNNPVFSKEIVGSDRTLTIDDAKVFLGTQINFQSFLTALHRPFTFERDIYLNEAVHWFYAAEYFDQPDLLEFASEKIINWNVDRVGKDPVCATYLAPLASRLATCSRAVPLCLRFRVYCATIHMLSAIFSHLHCVQKAENKKPGIDDKLDHILFNHQPSALKLVHQAMWDILRCLAALGQNPTRGPILDLLCAL